VCRPHAAWSATEIGLVPRLGPEAPVWTPVVCPTRRKPGARQPEQYALDPGIGQIPPTRPPVQPVSGETARGAIMSDAPTTTSYSGVRYIVMSSSTSTYAAWQRLSGRPGGSRLFSVAAMARVPYFASVLPHVVRMEPGLAEVRVPKWFFVYNHLHTVHAIASCNAAEVAMGMLMEATVPRTHRWIPKAMTVQYLGKATTSLRARAQLDPPDFTQMSEGSDGFDLVVPVSITDRSGNEVVHADITTWVTPVG
jgi:acyl-coenzyme A thioesterase PaaI-like protein